MPFLQHPMDDAAVLLPNVTVPKTYLAFINGVEYRTKCCKADLHPQCFDHVSGPCLVCQVEWNRDRQPITENRGGAEYVFLTRTIRLNKKHRREGTPCFLRHQGALGYLQTFSGGLFIHIQPMRWNPPFGQLFTNTADLWLVLTHPCAYLYKNHFTPTHHNSNSLCVA